jgi:L-alanine-DL-glutamate epimerase-like enolase superfamily enzyme
VGGIGAWKRVALAAETEGTWCLPHCFSTGILASASLHLLANQPTEQMIEWPMEGSPLSTSLVVSTMQMVDGYVDVPSGPGLGIDLDWMVIERFRVG